MASDVVKAGVGVAVAAVGAGLSAGASQVPTEPAVFLSVFVGGLIVMNYTDSLYRTEVASDGDE